MATLTVSYGPEGRYRVELRLNNADQLVARYLPCPDGIGRASDWEVRAPDTRDPEHVAIIAAFRTVLAQYDEGERVNEDRSREYDPAA